MLIKNTIALSLAAVLISASAAMAATTHHSRRVTAPRQAAQDQVEQDDAAYGSAARWQNQGRQSYAAGPFYYEPQDNGSPFAYYPGYTTR
jgi:hypothetical protein